LKVDLITRHQVYFCPRHLSTCSRMEKERFKKLFPHLAEEMESGRSRVTTADIEGTLGRGKKENARMWAGYDPDVVDFIRRCSTDEDAEEIIRYMEGRGEINKERADELRRQLRDEGLESFGSRKEADFYHKDL
jgi:hypothetical protein